MKKWKQMWVVTIGARYDTKYGTTKVAVKIDTKNMQTWMQNKM